MQVDPRTAGAQIVVTTPDGGGLTLDPGRQVVARVLETGEGGAARISLAGQSVTVRSDVPLAVGDQINLTVTRADTGGVRFSIDAGGVASGGAPGSSGNAIISELARAGVPVTPQIAQAVARVVDQLGAAGGATAQAAAGLAGRGLPVTAQLAGRVAAAVDLAGQLGTALTNLARVSPEVAAALPSGAPTAAALRGLLAPSLSNAELAVARIVQSVQAATGHAPITVPTSSLTARPNVIANYIASQLAAVNTLDDLAAQNTVLGTSSLLQARGQSVGPQPSSIASGTGITAQALEGALRGQLAAQAIGGGAAQSALAAAPGAPGSAGAAPGAPGLPAPAGTQQSATSGLPQPPAHAAATASAATGSAAAAQQGTAPRVAQAVADLGTQVARLAASLAPGTSVLADAAQQAGRGMNATEIAQQQGRAAGSAASLGVGGAGVDGESSPLLQSIRQFLAAPGGAHGDAAQLLRTLGGSDTSAARAALQQLPESTTLQLAGKLLDLANSSAASSSAMDPARLAQLKLGIHNALDDLGRALAPPGSDDLSALRKALEHVATNDLRPAVQQEAARMLQAADGQHLMSRTAQGADPGFVYFQVPMPDGRGAEVLVRREPGRRALSFDEFDIAFLLDTQAMGTLMIHLDAHPGGVRADVKTDMPELEPFLRAQAEALMGPLGRESRRPVTVTTGIFEDTPPTSLLDVPDLGQLTPGANEFYA